MLTYKELISDTWQDFENLFGNKGASGGCWCMYWRLKASEYKLNQGQGNKNKMNDLLKQNKSIGIIVYMDVHPVAWCSVAQRNDFIRLENSRILKPVDEQAVWSIVCFFIKKEYRQKGLSSEVIKCAIDYCKLKNAKIIEAYPIEPNNNNMPAVFAWTGFSAAFLKAGFVEVARRSKTRPIMRYYIS